MALTGTRSDLRGATHVDYFDVSCCCCCSVHALGGLSMNATGASDIALHDSHHSFCRALDGDHQALSFKHYRTTEPMAVVLVVLIDTLCCCSTHVSCCC